jgi:hypothetical protein
MATFKNHRLIKATCVVAALVAMVGVAALFAQERSYDASFVARRSSTERATRGSPATWESRMAKLPPWGGWAMPAPGV